MSDEITIQRDEIPIRLDELVEKLKQGDSDQMKNATKDPYEFSEELESYSWLGSRTRRCLKYEAMSLVLNNIKDISILSAAVPFLSNARASDRQLSVEYLGLLFAAIADLEAKCPDKKVLWGNTNWEPMNRWMISREESAFYELYKLEKSLQSREEVLWPLQVAAWSENESQSTTIQATLRGVTSDLSFLETLENPNVWINVPYLNGLIIGAIFRTVGRMVDPNLDAKLQSDYFLENCFGLPAIVPNHHNLKYRDPTYKSLINMKSNIVVFPCLALVTDQDLKYTRDRHSELVQSLNLDSEGISMERVRIYRDRTLDETYYPGLDMKSLKDRNNDQVVSREYKRTRQRDEGHLPILMVPQLWLWRMNHFLVSAYSHTRFINPAYSNIRQWRHVTPIGGDGPEPIDLKMARIIASHIEVFGRGQQEYREYPPRPWIEYPPILDMFETAVCSTLSGVDNYRKQRSLNLMKEGEFIHYIADIRSELCMIQSILKQQRDLLGKLHNDPLADTHDSIQKDCWDTFVRAKMRLSIGSLVDVPNEIGSLLDEILTILDHGTEQNWNESWAQIRKLERLLHDLSEVGSANEVGNAIQDFQKSLNKAVRDHSVRTHYVREKDTIVMQARERLDQYEERVKKIDGDAERIQATIDAMLNLKRTHASINDAKNSIMIGYAALGFAIVTIIFTPLTFIATLYALPIDRFINDQKSGTKPDSKVYEYEYISNIIVRAGLATVFGTLGIVIIVMVAPKIWDRIPALWTGAGEGIKKQFTGKNDPNNGTAAKAPKSTGTDPTETPTKWWQLRRRQKKAKIGEP
jgi:Mg2+ and Co2+ transporter CorA